MTKRKKTVKAMEEPRITMKEYVDTRIEDVKKAVDVAREGMDKRLDGMNEFRQQLNDQKATFVTKAEQAAWRDKLDADIKGLQLSKATLEGKATQTSFYISLVFSVVGAIAGLVGIVSRFL